MQDQPSLHEIVVAVAAFLRNDALPALSGRNQYMARVSANVMDIVARELEHAPASDAAERERLRELLGQDGDLFALNQALCARLESGEMGLHTPGLFEHLWRVTLDKIAIDQPGYSGYKRALKENPT